MCELISNFVVLFSSSYEMKPISLKALGNWLLCGKHEDLDNPPKVSCLLC
jgi:hypothetical protein